MNCQMMRTNNPPDSGLRVSGLMKNRGRDSGTISAVQIFDATYVLLSVI